MTAKQLDFYFDVVCPYAYLASTQVEAVAKRLDVQVRWRSVLLGGLFRHAGAPPDLSETRPAARTRLDRADIARWADLWGVSLRFPSEHPRRTVDAMRALVACEPERRAALARSLFEAYWVRGDDVSDRNVVANIARAHGVATQGDQAPWHDERVRQALRDETEAAYRAGVFGVPTFVADGRLAWGQDRLALLQRWLSHDEVDPSVWADQLRDGKSQSQSGPGRDVVFFHDFSSPFSYLAATQIERVATRHGARVIWTPILLGALFREIGTPDVPLHTMHQAKQAWVLHDLKDWAEAWNVGFRFPTHFPMRSLLPLRVALAEPSATLPMYRAAWAEDRRIDEPRSLAAVLDQAGLPGDALVDAAGAVEIKQALRDNTERARRAGACGVPTYEIASRGGDPILLWGQDRLVMLDAVLRGWEPPILQPARD